MQHFLAIDQGTSGTKAVVVGFDGHGAGQVVSIAEVGLRPFQDADRIAGDPEYGRIVCFCERVTAGEIRDALHSPIPPADLDGLRRRTRVMNGRCQGFYCGAHTTALLDARGGAR